MLSTAYAKKGVLSEMMCESWCRIYILAVEYGTLDHYYRNPIDLVSFCGDSSTGHLGILHRLARNWSGPINRVIETKMQKESMWYGYWCECEVQKLRCYSHMVLLEWSKFSIK